MTAETEANPATFRLIGSTTVFRLVERYKALGGTLPCVVGRTLDGRRETVAREVDVIWMEG